MSGWWLLVGGVVVICLWVFIGALGVLVVSWYGWVFRWWFIGDCLMLGSEL